MLLLTRRRISVAVDNIGQIRTDHVAVVCTRLTAAVYFKLMNISWTWNINKIIWLNFPGFIDGLTIKNFLLLYCPVVLLATCPVDRLSHWRLVSLASRVLVNHQVTGVVEVVVHLVVVAVVVVVVVVVC